ncbi:MAG: hypothetical protein ACK5LY_04635 [Lachnospirales bacterium]
MNKTKFKRNINNDIVASHHRIKLQHSGGKVNQIDSKVCYVSFMVGDIEVEYVYNINHHDMFFIERIKPYPEPFDTFNDEKAVVDQILDDVERFKKANKSKNIEEFIDINKSLSQLIKNFEDLYLYYNVPKKDADDIYEKVENLVEIVYNIKNNSERVYFDSEPKSFDND